MLADLMSIHLVSDLGLRSEFKVWGDLWWKELQECTRVTLEFKRSRENGLKILVGIQ